MNLCLFFIYFRLQIRDSQFPMGEQSAEILIRRDLHMAKGVRQGCVLSTMLFNIYVEKIFQLALDNVDAGIKVNGKPINNDQYADDTAILANILEDLQNILDKITEVSEQFGLSINIAKTKMMILKSTVKQLKEYAN